MNPVRTLVVVLALPLATLATPAWSAPCAGFTDVDSASGFCANVEWLKNRGITAGCTAASVYCPNNAVTRAQMALFLNRLGNFLTPRQVVKHESWSFGFPTVDLDSNAVICVMSPGPLTTAPGLAHGEGYVNGSMGNVAGNFTVQFVERVNAGAWTPVSTQRRGAIANGTKASVSVILPPRSLNAGTNYEWGLRVARLAGDPSVNHLDSWACGANVLLENRNGTSSPFDAAD